MRIRDLSNRALASLGIHFPDPELEARYQNFATARMFRFAQIGMLLGVLTYAIFGLWDLTSAVGGVESTRFRYMVAVPLISCFPALSLTAWARRWWQELVLAFAICTTVCIYETLVLLDRETIFHISTGNATLNYSLGLAFLALLPLRPSYTVLGAIGAQIAHALLVWQQPARSATLALFYCFHEACMFMIVCWIAYQRERMLRDEFVREQAISDERDLLKSQLISLVSFDALERARKGDHAVVDAYGEVTVIFCDIVGFTSLAERIAPMHLIELLNEVFSAIDQLALACHVEKVKTIGDAYMAISGTSKEDRNSAEDAAEFALRVTAEAARLAEAFGHPLAFRIGMHTGSLIGGVVGRQKMIYDYWGRTVNLASRLESSGVPGKIQVSEATFWRLSNKYTFEKRGALELKGIGATEAYLLVGRKPETDPVRLASASGL
jgi:class 3 adenylate cyclase